MAIARKNPKMRRTQISLLPEQIETVHRIAARRGVSLSQVIRDAIERMSEADTQDERDYRQRMWSIVGIVEGVDPDASVAHDEILYGHGEEANG